MYCEICGKREATDAHHLISGTANRQLADADKILLKLCRGCHDDIHRNSTTATLSKMVGQLLYEKEHSREEFLKRYGRSYI